LSEKLIGKTFHTVEACGILDYLHDKIALKLLCDAFNMLQHNGTLIVSNMIENRYTSSFTKICNWEMVYRTSEDLAYLVKNAGGKNVKVYREPWNTHAVAIAQKG
jgi:hypothetical protein